MASLPPCSLIIDEKALVHTKSKLIEALSAKEAYEEIEIKQKSIRKRYVLHPAIYTTRCVRQEVPSKAVSATPTQIDSTEEMEEVFNIIRKKLRVTCTQ